MKNAINWFEIPATDFARAKKFYETILNTQLHEAEFGDTRMAFFPMEEGGVGGSITQSAHSKPGSDGAVIYLNCGDEKGLDAAVARIGGAGGKVVTPKQDISPHGFIAWFIDTEGNRIGLHAR